MDQLLNEVYQSESIWNTAHYANPVIDDLIVKARGQDFEGQKETYAEIQRTLIDEVPRLMIGYQPWLWGVRKDVRGVAAHPLAWVIVQDAWLDD